MQLPRRYAPTCKFEELIKSVIHMRNHTTQGFVDLECEHCFILHNQPPHSCFFLSFSSSSFHLLIVIFVFLLSFLFLSFPHHHSPLKSIIFFSQSIYFFPSTPLPLLLVFLFFLLYPLSVAWLALWGQKKKARCWCIRLRKTDPITHASYPGYV